VLSLAGGRYRATWLTAVWRSRRLFQQVLRLWFPSGSTWRQRTSSNRHSTWSRGRCEPPPASRVPQQHPFNGRFPGTTTRKSRYQNATNMDTMMTGVMVTTGVLRRAKLQSNRHRQQTNTQLFRCPIPFLSTNRVKALKEDTSCVSYCQSSVKYCFDNNNPLLLLPIFV